MLMTKHKRRDRLGAQRGKSRVRPQETKRYRTEPAKNVAQRPKRGRMAAAGAAAAGDQAARPGAHPPLSRDRQGDPLRAEDGVWLGLPAPRLPALADGGRILSH